VCVCVYIYIYIYIYININNIKYYVNFCTPAHFHTLTVLDFRYWWHNIKGDYMDTVYRCAITIRKWPEMDHIIHKYGGGKKM